MKFSLIKIFLMMFVAYIVVALILGLVWSIIGNGVYGNHSITFTDAVNSMTIMSIFVGIIIGTVLGFFLIMITRYHQLEGTFNRALKYGIGGLIFAILLMPIYGYMQYWNTIFELSKTQEILVGWPFPHYYFLTLLDIRKIPFFIAFGLSAWAFYKLRGDGRKAKEKNQPYLESNNL